MGDIRPPFRILPSRAISARRIVEAGIVMMLDSYIAVGVAGQVFDGNPRASDLILGAALAILACVMIWALWSIWREFACFRGGNRFCLIISPERLQIVSPLASRSVPWSEIDCFEIERMGGLWDFVVTVRAREVPDFRIVAQNFSSHLEGPRKTRAEALGAFLDEFRRRASSPGFDSAMTSIKVPEGLVVAPVAIDSSASGAIASAGSKSP